MVRRSAFFSSLVSFLFLVSCQHGGGISGMGCIVGFVKVQNLCRPVNALSTAELNTVEDPLESSSSRSEEEFLVRAETKKMIAKLKEVRAVSERSHRNSEERYQTPAPFWGPLSRGTLGAPTRSLRSENAASFRNEFRSTSFDGSF